MLSSDLLFLGLCLACLLPVRAWPTGMNWYQKRNFKTLKSIYDLTIYPNQLPIIECSAKAVPKGLFNKNVVGRVDPVGNFTGFDDSIEYFFALAPLPQGNAASAAISRIQLTEFSSACPDVAASVVYLYTSVVNPSLANNGKPASPLKQIAFWKFDKHGAVLKYDAWIPNLNAWAEATTGAPLSNPQVQAGSIEQLCGATQQHCTGANTQYSSVAECVEVLSKKPYGNYDEAWGDNVVCRSIHVILTQVHCPHVGPTGGGKCVDYPYPQEYFKDQSLFGDKIGNTFTCNPPHAHSW